MRVLGLDIGGANLKAAHSAGGARTRPFALWKAPDALPGALRDLLRDWPSYDRLAVTMTGELCDCFASKRQGVVAILDAVAAVADTPVDVWLTDGRFVDITAARDVPLLAAASNWLALATFAGRLAPRGPALLFDVGSTTSDIVPLLDGRPVPTGRTDPERLRSGELVYTGVRRTPLCALLGGYGAAELFATTLDVYLTLGQVPEDASVCDTADGRPATRAAAAVRLARMLCADLETSTEEQRQQVAVRAAQRQVLLLTHALEAVTSRLPGPPETVVLSGSGEFLAEVAWRGQKTCPPCSIVSFAERLGPEVSSAACAYAVAVVAAESVGLVRRTGPRSQVPSGGRDLPGPRLPDETYSVPQPLTPAPVVVKVGGSLFDLPQLGARLTAWLATLAQREVVLVAGGGAAADVVRDLDCRHALGEEKSHWLALRSLSFTAHLLAALLPRAVVVDDLRACEEAWRREMIPVLDLHAFAQADEGRPGCLPHTWAVTSDALAARVARVVGARELVLLKSVTVPGGMTWAEAARHGFVDESFPGVVREEVRARAVNLREWSP